MFTAYPAAVICDLHVLETDLLTTASGMENDSVSAD